MGLGVIGNNLGQGGFPAAGRSPQDYGGKQAVRFYGAAQQPTWTNYLFLADKLI
jgi:hypothetical protein